MGFIIDDDDFVPDRENRLPLIGLYSAFKELKNLEYDKALVLPCDTPLVKYEVIDFLITQCKKFDCCRTINRNLYNQDCIRNVT